MTTDSPLFTEGHYKGFAAVISRVAKVTPAQGTHRSAPEPHFAIRVRYASRLDILKFGTRDEAERKYAALTYVAPEGSSERDRDEQDRVLHCHIMPDHYEAVIDPQPDGSLDVIVDGGQHRYWISADGADWSCVSSVEDCD